MYARLNFDHFKTFILVLTGLISVFAYLDCHQKEGVRRENPHIHSMLSTTSNSVLASVLDHTQNNNNEIPN